MAKSKKEKSEIDKLDINKDEIVEEIKNDVKEELLEEVKRKIDYESKKSLENAEKKIYKYKNFSIMKRNIVILIFLALIIFETKILYDNDLLFKNDRKISNDVEIKEDNNEAPEEIVKDNEWYLKNYSYLLDNLNTNLPKEDTYYLYKDNLTVNSIKNSVKLNMAYQLLSKEDKKVENGVITVSEEKLKESYGKIFKIDSYVPENFNDNCVQFIYNSSTKLYMAISVECDVSKEELIRNIKSIKEDNGNIIIEALVGLYNEETKTLKSINGEIILENISKDSINNELDKLSRYEFIFELVDRKYYLKEIKK